MVTLLAQTFACALAVVSLGLGVLLWHHIRRPLGLVLWPLKLAAGSLAPFAAAGGILAALAGLALRAPVAACAGAAGALLSAIHIVRVTRCAAPTLPAARPIRSSRRPRWQRDVPFCTPPGSSRPLLCDLWRPPEGVAPTGLALVYCHSSSWHLADKDVWTRPLFRHLAMQGHVVMDVAYRLCPEADLRGMLGDAERAIAWMKANAARYGARPERVVAMGASAGGQLALLAAYAPGHPELTPPDLQGVDTSVCGVVSYYGLADMRAFYAHAAALLPGAGLIARVATPPVLYAVERLGRLVPGRPIAGQAWKLAGMSCDAMMASLLGGSPDEVPVAYDLTSPITHAGPHCPPTLLVHGEHDTAVPTAPTRALYRKLAAAGVPTGCLILPQTDHIFDLLLPQVSLAAHVAQSHLDGFLAKLA